MYKIKLGFQLLRKKIVLNIIIILQLAVIVTVINTIAMYVQDVNYLSNITSELLDSQLIWLYSSADENLIDIKGGKILNSYLSRGAANQRNYELRYMDIELLSKFDFKTKKGRWLNENDKGTTNAVVSYTNSYNVGDVFTHVKNGKSLTIKIVGMLEKNEKLVSVTKGGNTINSIFDTGAHCDEVFYLDVNEYCDDPTFVFSGKSIISYAENPLPQNEYDKIVGKMESKSDGFSSQYIKDFMDGQASHTLRLAAPLIAFIFVISILAFWMISVISFNSYRREFAILKSNGATKIDLISILAIYLIIPVAIIIAIFTPLSGVQIVPVFLTVRVTFINYIIPFMVGIIFLLFNFIMLYYKFFRKGGIEEVWYEKKL